MDANFLFFLCIVLAISTSVLLYRITKEVEARLAAEKKNTLDAERIRVLTNEVRNITFVGNHTRYYPFTSNWFVEVPASQIDKELQLLAASLRNCHESERENILITLDKMIAIKWQAKRQAENAEREAAENAAKNE